MNKAYIVFKGRVIEVEIISANGVVVKLSQGDADVLNNGMRILTNQPYNTKKHAETFLKWELEKERKKRSEEYGMFIDTLIIVVYVLAPVIIIFFLIIKSTLDNNLIT